MRLILYVLVGGPFDGCVVDGYGAVPLIMLGDPRDRTLLDVPGREAVWVPRRKWYEQQAA